MNTPAIADRQHGDDVAIEAAYPREIARDIYAGAWREGMSVNDFLVDIATGRVDPCVRRGRWPSRFPVPMVVSYPRLLAEQIHAATQREGLSLNEFLARLAAGRVCLVEEDPVERAKRLSAPLRAEDERRARVVAEAEAAVIASLGSLDDYDLAPAHRRVAEARLANPDLSYRQLGELLGMTKHAVSGVMRRFWERVEKPGTRTDPSVLSEGRRLRPLVGPRPGPRQRKAGPRVLLVGASGAVSYCDRRIYIGLPWKGQRVIVTEPQPNHVVVKDHATGAVLNELDLGPVGTHHGNGRKPGPGYKTGPRVVLADRTGSFRYCGRRIAVGQAWAGQRVIVAEPIPGHVIVRDHATGAVLREIQLGPVGTYHGSGRKPGRRSRGIERTNATVRQATSGLLAEGCPLSRSGEVA